MHLLILTAGLKDQAKKYMIQMTVTMILIITILVTVLGLVHFLVKTVSKFNTYDNHSTSEHIDEILRKKEEQKNVKLPDVDNEKVLHQNTDVTANLSQKTNVKLHAIKVLLTDNTSDKSIFEKDYKENPHNELSELPIIIDLISRASKLGYRSILINTINPSTCQIVTGEKTPKHTSEINYLQQLNLLSKEITILFDNTKTI